VNLATLFKNLSDPTRLRILNLLATRALCVCEIQDAMKEPQVKISKHLAYLRSHELVHRQRQANWNVYSLSDDSHLLKAMRIVTDAKETQKEFSRDLTRLKEMESDPRCPIEIR